MKSVADILEHVCLCGGDPSGPMHQESLLHRRWLLGEGLKNHDPLATEDRRPVEPVVPTNARYELR